MKNKHGWGVGDIGIVVGLSAFFKKGCIVKFMIDDGSDIPWFKGGGVDEEPCHYSSLLNLTNYFQNFENPTNTEIQLFEMIYPELKGLIKPKES